MKDRIDRKILRELNRELDQALSFDLPTNALEEQIKIIRKRDRQHDDSK